MQRAGPKLSQFARGAGAREDEGKGPGKIWGGEWPGTGVCGGRGGGREFFAPVAWHTVNTVSMMVMNLKNEFLSTSFRNTSQKLVDT